uniref:DUF19 domain-containing protein n=1 Tax=Caenorhabditis tropicalis TaxID=1561998 RepID=A0A1I7V2A6_9PELO
MKFLLLITGIILTGVLGAPTDKCTVADNILGISCAEKALSFLQTAKNLKNKKELYDLKKPCEDLDYCSRAVSHCTAYLEANTEQGFKIIKTMCSSIEFGVNEFADCEEKMDVLDSECYKSWDAFQTDGTCDNFFGEDQCVKKEVTETCGVTDWEKLRDVS